MADILTINPGKTALEDWRRVLQGAPFSVARGAKAAVDAAAATITAVQETDRPVYGVNTGFGKLARERIATSDLSTLQVNLIASHSAGTGPALPAPLVRLIIALKIGSLARGASGIRWQVIETLERMTALDLLPVIPAQGSVGASGDLAPLAHMSAAMLGLGDVTWKGAVVPAGQAFQEAGLRSDRARTQGRPGADQRHPGLDRPGAGPGCSRIEQEPVPAPPWSPARSRSTPRSAPTRRSTRASRPARPARPDRRRRCCLRALLDGSEIRESHVWTATGCRTPTACAASRRSWALASTLLRQHGGHPGEIEANAVTDNPLVFPDTQEVLSGGNFHAEPVAFAADTLALAVAEIGAMAERRIATADRFLDQRPAPLPDRRAGPQLRLHDRPRHRRRARRREQAARDARQRRQPADLGQPGRPRLHGDPRRPAPGRWPRTAPRSSRSSCWRPARGSSTRRRTANQPAPRPSGQCAKIRCARPSRHAPGPLPGAGHRSRQGPDPDRRDLTDAVGADVWLPACEPMMSDFLEIREGRSPLVLSMPHGGRALARDSRRA